MAMAGVSVKVSSGNTSPVLEIVKSNVSVLSGGHGRIHGDLVRKQLGGRVKQGV